MGIFDEMREDLRRRNGRYYSEQEVLDLVDEARRAKRAPVATETKREVAQTPNDDDSEWTFKGKDMRGNKFWQMRHDLRQRNGRYFTEQEILGLVAEAKREIYGK